MNDINKDLKHFEYTTDSKYEIVEALLKKEYPESDIIDAFNNYTFKPKWNGNLLGGVFIILAICFAFNIKATFGSFDYEFDSAGDFFRLNEWVLKPFLILSLFYIGINALVNKGFVTKNTRLIMLFILSFFMISSITANSPYSLLLGLISLICFAAYKTNPKITDITALIDAVKLGKEPKKSILHNNDTAGKTWKGSSIFIFILLAFCLLLNSPIDVSAKFSGSFLNFNYDLFKDSLTPLDKALRSGLKTLLAASFISSILFNINIKKFKYVLLLLMALSLVYIIICVIHPNFQKSIFPALVIIISGVITITQHNLFGKDKS